MKLILASSSSNRHSLLEQAHIRHLVIPANIDESEIEDKDPKKRIVKIAVAKAEKIAAKEKNALILAADTFAIYRNQIIEKPKFKMDALEILKSFAGTSHQMLTGWCLINTKTGNKHTGLSDTRVFFRQLDHQTLLDYVNDYNVVQWAAGYSPYDTPAIHFIDKIQGSLNGFMNGLPLEQIMPIVEKEQN